ncbi:MAG: hypothetical protein M3519_02430 [Actinomycetota bacterium]|nr:hypothetical protein [Actinomycetota bacterium]
MRRALLITAVSAALLTVGACGSEEVDAPPESASPTATPTAATGQDETTETGSGAPTTSEPEETDTTTATITATSAATTTEPPVTTTVTQTVTATETATATGSTTATTTATETGSPTTSAAAPAPEPPPGVECSSGAYSPGPPRTADAPEPVVTTAQLLLDSAMACDSAALISLATQDDTAVSFGGVTVEEALALPDVEGRYLVLAAVLSGTDPGVFDTEEGQQYRWPAASAESTPSDAQWQQVVDAGLYTQADVDQMRAGDGYTGWRVGIATDGTWQFFIAGD